MTNKSDGGKPHQWSPSQAAVLEEMTRLDPGWVDVASQPWFWGVGPRALAVLADAARRGWSPSISTERIVLSRDQLLLEVFLTDEGSAESSNWHWARFYTNIGPFPDDAEADRAIADFGMHGPFEHVGMERENGQATLRIGFRLAQDLDALFLDLDNIPRSLQKIADQLWKARATTAQRPSSRPAAAPAQESISSKDDVERRLVGPFYLHMMRLNARSMPVDLWDKLVAAAREATVSDVQRLLSTAHWRPVVMGAWFSHCFPPPEIGAHVLEGLGRCRGSLTAPPLTVAALHAAGQDAVPALSEYLERDLANSYGSASLVAAALEQLGSAPSIASTIQARAALADLIAVAGRLRTAILSL